MITEIDDLTTYLIKFRKELQLLAEQKEFKNYLIEPKLLYFCNINTAYVETKIEKIPDDKWDYNYNFNSFYHKNSNHYFVTKSRSEAELKVKDFLKTVNNVTKYYSFIKIHYPVASPVLLYFKADSGYYGLYYIDELKDYNFNNKLRFITNEELVSDDRRLFTKNELNLISKQLES